MATTRMQPWLGTYVAIRASRADGSDATAAIDAAFAAIADVHRTASFHAADSGLTRLNREGEVHTGPLLRRIVRASLALARASRGVFDPVAAGRLAIDAPPAALAGVTPPHADADWRDVSCLADGRIVTRRPLWIDLGGIAKGYAVDQAVRVLRRSGIDAGVVNAGGDLRVFGNETQTIHVRPTASHAAPVPLLSLREGACAGSGRELLDIDAPSPWIDPDAGLRPADPPAVTVTAPRAIWADALAKIVLLRGEAAAPLLRRLRASAAIREPDGRIRFVATP